MDTPPQGMTYSSLQQSAEQSRSFPRPAPPDPPPGVRLAPNEAWHPELGVIPAVWGPRDIYREMDLRREQREYEERQRNSRAHEPAAPPVTVPLLQSLDELVAAIDQRLTAIEAILAKLTAPAAIKGRASPRPSRHTRGGDPPAAA